MKIGIVTEYYYPFLGGITENVHNSRAKLEDMGHAVKIITSNTGSWQNGDGDANDSDAGIVRLGRSIPVYANGSFARVTVGGRLRNQLSAILEGERFDILHIHSPLVFTLPLLSLIEAKCPAVGTFHTSFGKCSFYSVFRNKLQVGVNKLKGRIIVSRACQDSLSQYFDFNARVIPNGVDTQLFHPEASPLEKFNDGKINLLFLSRFDPRNGLSLMLRAFEIIKSQVRDVRLVVVGDGPLSFYYKKQVPYRLRKDVHFEGLVDGGRPNYYASCDVFCSPVTKASFGITLLEAMASGKPIVATENPGYKELLAPDEGVLLPSGDPNAFANAILNLLADEKLRREMGANGRRKALSYSWDTIARSLMDYYLEVLEK